MMAKKTVSKHKKSESAQRSQAERFEFTAIELATLIAHLHLQPVSGSPLKDIAQTDAAAGTPRKINYETREALERLARPETKLNLVYCTPPEPPLIAAYYGLKGNGDFVLHEQHAGGTHRLVYPVDAFSLFETGAWALQFERPAETSGFTLVLDRSAFETMAGIVDLIQEHTLNRMLQRRLPAGELSFSAEDVAECCKRGIETMDSRWMAPRAVLAAPLPLSFQTANIQHGLEWLCDAGALQAEGKQYGLKSVFSLVCSRLINCNGLFTVSTQRREEVGNGSQRWLQEHCSGLRCGDGLWQLEFFGITKGDFKVTLLDITPHMLYGRLIAALFPPQPAVSAQTAETPHTAEPSQERCPQCNAILKPGKRFCTRCGAPLPRA